jgi:hypothetical protein
MHQGSYPSRTLLTIPNLTTSPEPSASYEYMLHGSLKPACTCACVPSHTERPIQFQGTSNWLYCTSICHSNRAKLTVIKAHVLPGSRKGPYTGITQDLQFGPHTGTVRRVCLIFFSWFSHRRIQIRNHTKTMGKYYRDRKDPCWWDKSL